ncbi:MAG: thioredoxin [Egibacteraceae bacterium]
MSTKAVTDADWETEVLQSDKPVLVDFWAEWCGPCRMVSPIVDAIAKEKAKSLKVVKLNVDENLSVPRRYGVMSIPTLLLIADGVEKRRLVGARAKSQLLADIEEFL